MALLILGLGAVLIIGSIVVAVLVRLHKQNRLDGRSPQEREAALLSDLQSIANTARARNSETTGEGSAASRDEEPRVHDDA